LVSINRFGTGAGNSSGSWLVAFSPVISRDGRFVAFSSNASDLTANDTNGGTSDVFVRDLQLGTTTLVSINRFGTGSGNSFSDHPEISPDGRFVAFTSNANDLTATNDTNGGASDVFVRDLQIGDDYVGEQSTGLERGLAMLVRALAGRRSARTDVSWRSGAVRPT
jgi:Tol biopolymer transport system component